MVPNLNITTTEVDLIFQEITGQKPSPPSLPAPSIRQTPIDEASGKDRIFAMAFPTLYPTGQADFNTPRLRKVDLNDYAQHLMRFHDGRFGRHPRWRFFVFNILMRRKANSSARFYVSKASGLKDLSRDELAEALLADEGLLPQIVRQGSDLTGTRPYWKNKSNSLQAQARFLSPSMSPVFVTFSAADMQWQDLHRHFPGFTDLAAANDRTRRTFVWDGVQRTPAYRRSLLGYSIPGLYRPRFTTASWGLQTPGTGLSGRPAVLATPMASFGFRLHRLSTRIPRKPALNSPSIGAW